MKSDKEPEVEQDERGRYDNIFGGAGASRAAPLAATGNDRQKPSAAKRVGRGFLSWARTAAITLGVMYVLGWVATVGFVTAVNTRFARARNYSNTHERAAANPVTVAYRLASDPTITPDAAGVALAALTSDPTRPLSGFTYRDIASRPSAPWRTLPIPPDIFPGVSLVNGVPDPNKILEFARRPLTALQRQALRMIGSAEIWRSFDLVSRASAVDVIGGRLVVPFGAGAHLVYLPTMGNRGTRWLAQAGVSRAAWHLSEGRRDSAEFVLRGIISFGAAIVENAPLLVDQLAGTAVLNTGRSALIQYFTLAGDARGRALAADAEAAVAGYRRPAVLEPIARGDLAEVRPRMVARISARELTRAMRIETLTLLNAAGCQSFRQVAFGQDDLVRNTAEALKADLARFPSERAVIDLMARPLGDPSIYALLVREGPGAELLTTISKLYFNPRIASCGVGGGTFR
ncbi:MAG: hypothetical protein P3A28_01520 [Gemmatimonadota bacterium]|nr:hypothetical protein [Gemmatimonadota bacterium]